MNTLALKDGFGSGFKTAERWQEGIGLDWFPRGDKKEVDLTTSPMLLLYQLSDVITGTMVASYG